MLLFIAILLPKALPPMVKAAIIAVTNKVTINILISKVLAKKVAIITPAEPDIIPHISPITSLMVFSFYWYIPI